MHRTLVNAVPTVSWVGGIAALFITSGVAFAQTLSQTPFPSELKSKIQHVIILYPENRSFDSLYGKVPGVNGLAQAALQNSLQVNAVGLPFSTLPQPSTSGMGIPGITAGPDARFPSALPNAPYDTEAYAGINSLTGDLVHRFYTEQYQINNPLYRVGQDPKSPGGSTMSKMAAYSDNPGLVMSHYDAQDQGEGLLGRSFVLCDNAFHSAFGGSFLNHMWLVAARTPVWQATPPAPAAAPAPSNATVFDANGFPAPQGVTISDGGITADPTLPAFTNSNTNQSLAPGDYWCVNTTRALQGPAGGFSTPDTTPGSPTSNTAVSARLPLQTYDTIGDRLSAKGISWAYFAGGWNDAKAGRADFLFQFHHQPFAYFANFALQTSPVPATATAPAKPGVDSPGSAEHLKDELADFYTALGNGALPTVSWVKPIGEDNSHPGYASVKRGAQWVTKIMSAIESSPIWDSTVVILIYDEHGGLWDHVTPPVVDAWGPGLRVPMIVASPFSKKGYIDHTQYETVSTLTFLEGLFDLTPLNTRDAQANYPLAPFAGQPDEFLQATAGKAFSGSVPPNYFGASNYRFDGAAPVAGLKVDPNSGAITGVPAKAGVYDLKVAYFTQGHAETTVVRLSVGAN